MSREYSRIYCCTDLEKIVGAKQNNNISSHKCYGCTHFNPKYHYCYKYLRGIEKAIYLCSFYLVKEEVEK